MFDKEKLRRDGKPKTMTVSVPAWAATFTIRQLDALQLLKLKEGESELSVLAGVLGVTVEKLGGAQQIVACVVDDETGNLVFTDADIPELLGYSVAGFLALNLAIGEFNGLTDQLPKN